ncbi:Predicted N-acetyltransferase YhbS [Nannocystis exedens]|uniref:Predicted N-acetyltransferase YhbS n=1 Tax=Nannocystis exedens TaxID=54 RepID=A0A1I2FE12_9BACT|nr:GNAT family N-acetyltransferase [Nannocystis exedens]PCC70478.1 acetyltransferase [Nannocystis exedens]SFF03652.1 Predicted N-acetyltransferase YhbS [Nannocystis exedens]
MNMNCRIRPAHPAEIETIRGIERASARRFVGVIDELVDDEPSPAAVLAARMAGGGLWVAECEGAPVAFVMFRPVEDGLYIEQIDVLPAFERRRIGAALLDAAAERARAAGLARLTLSTFRDVLWNAPYYRRLGFVDIADEALTAGLAQIRQEHVARGLDESRRTFMARPL